MHIALHPRDDIDTLYVSRKGGKALAKTEDFIDLRFEDYIKKNKES